METDGNYPAQFKNVIEKIIDAELNKRGITKYISALVKGVNDNGTVNVCIPPNLDSIISGLLNKTGETLSEGDSVELCAKNGSVNNSWVAIKHKTNNSGGGGTNVNIDNNTITKNSSDEIQAVGVIDQKTTSSDRFWTGTIAEYNAITTKDENTFYYITDDYSGIVDSGTNDNGSWVKYSNGDMECTKRVTQASVELTGSWYGHYINANDGFIDLGDYPMTFVSEPIVSLTYMGGNGCWIINNNGHSASTPGKIQLCTVSSRTIGLVIIDIIAKGKWR